MGNKQQLQLNNETLASILSNVLGLPSQESLKHGAYVWKKYTTTPIYVENSSEFYQKVVITEPQNAAITYEFSTTYTFDKNTGLFTLGSGGGIRIAYDSSGKIDEPSKYYMIGTRTGRTMYKNDGTSGLPTLYNNAGGVTILAYNDSHLVTEYQSELIYEKSDFIDFVVSDSPTAYPDGGEQGGYYYEKLDEKIDMDKLAILLGCSNVAVDKFTFTSDTGMGTSINHTLGIEPKLVMVLTTGITSSMKNSNYWKDTVSFKDSGDSVMRYWNNNGVEVFSHSTSVYAISTSKTISFTGGYENYQKYKAGIEYTLITMA